VLKCPSSGKS
jgi:hypothetical protein